MKNKINFAWALLLSMLFVMSCQSVRNVESPPPPPPPPAPVFAMQMMSMPVSVSQARQEFRTFRQTMGYLDPAGRDVDRRNGYFDLNIETLRSLYEEAANRGWKDVRIYNGIDASGNRTLLMNGIRVNGGKVDEAGKADADPIVKIDNPSVAPGSDCPRWCDIGGTVVGR